MTQTALVFLQSVSPWTGSDKADDNLRTVALSLSLVIHRRPRLHILALERVLLFPKEEKGYMISDQTVQSLYVMTRTSLSPGRVQNWMQFLKCTTYLL